MASHRPIVVASRNPGKVREIAAVLAAHGFEAVGLDEVDADRSIAEPAETGDTFAENARDKARYYARATGAWALADDSGLIVDALGGRPGVHSARYGAEDAPPDADRPRIDRANNDRLLRELTDVPDDARTARFVCHLALSDGDETLLEAAGAVEGLILREPRGCNGFGYDPLFLVPALGLTAAEMPPEQKNAVSHRGLATREFARRFVELVHAPEEGCDHA